MIDWNCDHLADDKACNHPLHSSSGNFVFWKALQVCHIRTTETLPIRQVLVYQRVHLARMDSLVKKGRRDLLVSNFHLCKSMR